ncbi:MAG: methyltransferase [Chitinophagaceae bacterium]|nr:MAG: methyltransferase [Chitinophagaceae bacterium]
MKYGRELSDNPYFAPVSILDSTEKRRIEANRLLDPTKKSKLGQFFTPAPICQFMASLFIDISDNTVLLEPGCGVGSMIAAFTDEAILRGKTKTCKALAFDIESIIEPYILQTLEVCKEQANVSGINFSFEFNLQDFILNFEQQSTLFNSPEVSHVLMNPPYKKINSDSAHRKALSKAGIETVNLYSGFVALAIKMLKSGGELVAIIPRSFCNGPYYHAFRRLILEETSIQHIHIFESREQAFNDDEVLQENIIIHCQKGRKQGKVRITSSPIADFHIDSGSKKIIASDMTFREIEIDALVKPNDKQQFFHIATSESEQHIIDALSVFTSSLSDIGVEVSTGPVVDFRTRDNLKFDLSHGGVPLITSSDLNGKIHWKENSKKPSVILVNDATRSSLWKNSGCYVIAKRFSSKEERRRIVAAVYDSSLRFDFIGFDNKLNVFHSKKLGIDPLIAKGLFAYLNCTLVDKYYRQFGGHTQVNASDLKALHYPSLISLRRIGESVTELDTSQEKIDSIISKEIYELGGILKRNPLFVEEKISHATKLLGKMGYLKTPNIGRAAITLLAITSIHPTTKWSEAKANPISISDIINWSSDEYGIQYSETSIEMYLNTIIEPFLDLGIISPLSKVGTRNPIFSATPKAVHEIRGIQVDKKGQE